MRKLLIFLMIALFSYSVSADPQRSDVDLDKVKKEVKILTRIIKTALIEDEEDGSRERSQKLMPRRIESLYLDGQGIVLQIELGYGGRGDFLAFGDFDLELVEPLVAVAPLPPLEFSSRGTIAVNSPDSEDIVTAADMEVLEEVREAMEGLAMEAEGIMQETEFAIRADRLYSREFNERVRALQKERRKALRELREKEREALHLTARGKSLSEEQKAKILAEVKAYKQNLADYKQKAQAVKEEQKKVWLEEIVNFEDRLLNALCEYGSSLRSLPSNESLSLVLKKAERHGKRQLDKVFVLKKSDLIACQDGDISMNDLKKRSSSYSF